MSLPADPPSSDVQPHDEVATGARQPVALLLVEDHMELRELCLAYFETAVPALPCEIRTLEAASGEEALIHAQALADAGEELACAVVDFGLGGEMNGLETIAATLELHPNAQCALMSGHREQLEPMIPEFVGRDQLQRLDYMAKPFSEFVFQQHVRRLLAHWLTDWRERQRRSRNEQLVAELAQLNAGLEAQVRRRTDELANRNRELEGKNHELGEAFEELKQTQAFLLHQEKMASMGRLAAGVAHEINNPIGFINSNLGTLRRYSDKITRVLNVYAERGIDDETIQSVRREQKIDYVLADLPELVRESLEGTERVRKIVTDLKSFSRPSENEQADADLNDCLERALNIAHNELKYKATVSKDLGELPLYRCMAGQLNQVFLNLLVNAAQAIEGSGEIGVVTRHEGNGIRIAVSDNGSGIPEDALARIFDPFFTTKAPGEGTGLGLSISYDIVRKHGGHLSVESTPGEGTTFTIRLPIRAMEEES